MAAASIVINNMRAVLVKEDMVDMFWVVSEVAVVYIGTVGLEEVEVTLEEMVELMKSFPVGEGVDLLTMAQISRMNVVLIGMDMVE